MDLSKVKEWTIGGKQVKVLTIDGATYWQKKTNYEPFYVEDISGGANEVYFKPKFESKPPLKLEYSTNKEQWVTWSDPYTEHVTIPANGKLYMRGVNDYISGARFVITANCNVGGDLTTLLIRDGDKLTLEVNGIFAYLFDSCKTIINAKDLILPSTTLADDCYEYMFNGCEKLKTAPQLPAMTLAIGCYGRMFEDCTSLTQTPQLPATTLVDSCYHNMFNGCTSLTQAPELHSTQLANSCYRLMFMGCTSLTQAPALPATTLAPYCYEFMFINCTSLTTAPALPATTLVNSCYGSMFMGCISLNKVEVRATSWYETYADDWLSGVAPNGNVVAPYLTFDDMGIGTNGVPEGWTLNGEKPVTEIEPFYVEDASGQPNTFTIEKEGNESPTINLEYSTDNKIWQVWSGCQSTSLPIEANGRIYLRGTNNVVSAFWMNFFNCSGNYNVGGDITTLLVPEGNVLDLTGRKNVFNTIFKNSKTLKDVSKLILPSITLSLGCYRDMFSGCTSLITAPALPATTLESNCYARMFSGCTSLITAPALPATTLVDNCYSSMFSGCTALNKVEVGATSWDVANSDKWLEKVAPSGVIIKPASLVIPTDNVSGVPTGWTTQDK